MPVDIHTHHYQVTYTDPSYITCKICGILMFCGPLTPTRTSLDQLQTGLVTAKDRKRLVCCSSVQFFEVSRIGRTGYGYGLRHWAPKDWTGPDFQTLHRIWCKRLCIKHSMCHNCDACGHMVLCQHSPSSSAVLAHILVCGYKRQIGYRG